LWNSLPSVITSNLSTLTVFKRSLKTEPVADTGGTGGGRLPLRPPPPVAPLKSSTDGGRLPPF
jgi:hypothetical protein